MKTLKELGSELGTIICTKANNKTPTGPGVQTLVLDNDFFTLNKINTNTDKSKIIQRSLVMIHPDKQIIKDASQAYLISTTLNDLRDRLASKDSQTAVSQPSVDTQSPEMRAFQQSLLDSVFQWRQGEEYLFYLGGAHQSLFQWLDPKITPSPINAPVKFIAMVLNTHQEGLIYTRDFNTLLLRIALLDFIIKQVCVDQKPHAVISKYIHAKDTYPVQCKRDPILWLMNEIIADNSKINLKGSQPGEMVSNVETPPLKEILTFLLAYAHFPNLIALQNLLKKWSPNDYLPNVKALFSQLLTNFEKANTDLGKNTNRGCLEETTDGELVLKITNTDDRILALLQLDLESLGRSDGSFKFKYPLLSCAQNLEIIREDLLNTAQGLPIVLIVAKIQSPNSKGLVSRSDSSIGEILTNKLRLINGLINQERQKENVILEDPDFQPVMKIPRVAFLSLMSSSHVDVPYLDEVHIENPIDYNESARIKLKCSGNFQFPEIINPAVVEILQKCMEAFNIKKAWAGGFEEKYSLGNNSGNSSGSIEDIFSSMSGKLKGTYEEKQIMLAFTKKVFAPFKQKPFDSIFCACVEKYVKTVAAPVVLATIPLTSSDNGIVTKASSGKAELIVGQPARQILLDKEITPASPALVTEITRLPSTGDRGLNVPAPGDNLLKAGIALEVAGMVFFGLGFIPGLQILWAVSVLSFVVGLVIAECGQIKNNLAKQSRQLEPTVGAIPPLSATNSLTANPEVIEHLKRQYQELIPKIDPSADTQSPSGKPRV